MPQPGTAPPRDSSGARRPTGRRRDGSQVSANNPFALIEHVGEDCAGAVQFVRPDRLDRLETGSVSWVTVEDLGERIRRLRADPTSWLGPDDRAGHFSLAGAQAKFAVLRGGEEVGRSLRGDRHHPYREADIRSVRRPARRRAPLPVGGHQGGAAGGAIGGRRLRRGVGRRDDPLRPLSTGRSPLRRAGASGGLLPSDVGDAGAEVPVGRRSRASRSVPARADRDPRRAWRRGMCASRHRACVQLADRRQRRPRQELLAADVRIRRAVGAALRQRVGIGSALVRALLTAADVAHVPLVVPLGSPRYYGRFGFRPAPQLGVAAPDAGWGDAFKVDR